MLEIVSLFNSLSFVQCKINLNCVLLDFRRFWKLLAILLVNYRYMHGEQMQEHFKLQD